MSEGEVCFTNIGPKERAKRMRFGAVTLALALIATASLVALGIDRGWRVLLFLPFAGAATGYFQARDKT